MLRSLVFGLGLGAGIQAWRNFPPDGPIQPDSAIVVFLLGLLLAFAAGWGVRRVRPVSATASASAEASAEAHATNQTSVNVAVFAPGAGAAPAHGLVIPADQVSWRGSERAAITQNDLDGLDLAELHFDDYEPEAR